MAPDHKATSFEVHRSMLMGIAYRFLGSVSDAEDIVQDVYLKWSASDISVIENHQAWLKTVCARTCLDTVKSAERKRIEYVGTWLPEPIQTQQTAESDSLEKLELADSITTAFILTLERLAPKERAAYLLYEIFDTSYAEIAELLGLQQDACRKLVSRAKSNVLKSRKRNAISREKQSEFIVAFEQAINNGEQSSLQQLLAEDVILRADGGGKVAAIKDSICNLQPVMNFICKKLSVYWRGLSWVKTNINGNNGVIIKEDQRIHAAVSFEFNEYGQALEIFITRNPDKLNSLNMTTIN